MAYSDLYLKKNTKIPTVLAILIACFIGLFLIRLFSNSAIPSKAEKKIVRRVEIANISSNGATIYWQTSEKTVGWLIYGDNKNNINSTSYDDRDLLENKRSYIHHYVTLKNLKENQIYFFKLINGNKLEAAPNDLPFSFKTTQVIKDFKARDPAYGKIIEANGTPIENAVIILSIGDSLHLASLSKTTGEWLIPLNQLGTSVGPNEKATIEFFSENNSSQVITNISKLSPLPQTIIIGKNFDFTANENVLSATSNTNEAPKKEIDILYPKENALIPGYIPLIKGVALPNTEVMITVNSNTVFTSRVQTDSKGVWSLTLPSSLSWGDHTITMTTTDKEGNAVTVERKFTIAKNGEQVLGSATPEGTVTIPPVTPTVVYATPTRSLTPTPPVSGGNINIPLVGAASFIIVGIGLMLVF